MSNSISANHDPTCPDIDLNNGLTSVFLSVLLLSGSDLARTDWEVATVAWLAEHDQSIVGLGVVGFDVSHLGWTRERFTEQKAFLLRMIDGALARHRWEALSYQPHEEWLLPCLRSFRDMVERFPSEACPARSWDDVWSVDGLRSDRARCPRHDVYLNSLMTDDARCCMLCNDEGWSPASDEPGGI